MAYRMGDPDLTGRCFRNDRLLHSNCIAAGAELFPYQRVGDRGLCACECHGQRAQPSGGRNSPQRRQWDAWKTAYDRLVGTAEDLPG